MKTGVIESVCDSRSRLATSLSVRDLLKPEDIHFSGGMDGTVRIEITFRNTTVDATPSVPALIEAAPLGAFVGGVPLALVQLPSLSPGEAWVFRHDAPYAPATANRGGRAGTVGAPRVASDMEGNRLPSVGEVIRRWRTVRRNGLALPADPLHAFNRGSSHWAGNINVFIEDESVERHMARALRVVPGIVNAATFFVGDRPDAYRFELHGTGLEWQPEIWSAPPDFMLTDDFARATRITLDPRAWLEAPHVLVVSLLFTPPNGCRTGCLKILITQRSTNRTACVEFTFDAEAAGAGCYTL